MFCHIVSLVPDEIAVLKEEVRQDAENLNAAIDKVELRN